MEILISIAEAKKLKQIKEILRQTIPEAIIIEKRLTPENINPIKLNQLSSKKLKRRFLCKLGTTIKSITVNEIAYFYTENKTNFLCTNDGKKYPVDFNLDHAEQILDPNYFFRINRQFIIAHYAIAEMKAHSRSRIIIKLSPDSKLNTTVAIDRASDFRDWLSE